MSLEYNKIKIEPKKDTKESLVKRAMVLIEALPYIKAFAGKNIVVKTGGSFMEGNTTNKERVLTDVAFMQSVNMLPIVVHGGGPTLSKRLGEKAIKSEFVNGHRITSKEVLQEIHKVMNEEINPEYVRILQQLGAKAKEVHGEDIITAVKKIEIDRKTGKEIDLGFVGVPLKVDMTYIQMILNDKIIPVITPFGKGEDGQIYNINADLSAAAVAIALQARKLVYLSDTPGVLRDSNDSSTLISELYVDEIESLKHEGIIKGGMLPKVESAVETLRAGVENVHFIDGRLEHALLLELFTDHGIGTIFSIRESSTKVAKGDQD